MEEQAQAGEEVDEEIREQGQKEQEEMMDIVPEDSNLWNWEISRLEFMIKLGNKLIKWLMSDDPMFKEDEYKNLVAPTKERLTKEVRQMMIVCRAKKMERAQLEAEFMEHVKVGLKPGRLNVKRL